MFSSENQSWDSAAFSTASWVCAYHGALLAGRVGGGMWGTRCIWLSSPPYDGTPRDMLDFILIWEKISLSDKWIWDKVLEVGALLRKGAMSYTVLVYPGYIPIQPLSGLSTTLIYAFPYKYSNTEYVGKKQSPQGVTRQAVG